MLKDYGINYMKIKNIIVIVKLDNDDIHQVMMTKSDEGYVLNLIEQLHNKSIKLNEVKLTALDIE
jgi:hypothetical protein